MSSESCKSRCTLQPIRSPGQTSHFCTRTNWSTEAIIMLSQVIWRSFNALLIAPATFIMGRVQRKRPICSLHHGTLPLLCHFIQPSVWVMFCTETDTLFAFNPALFISGLELAHAHGQSGTNRNQLRTLVKIQWSVRLVLWAQKLSYNLKDGHW